MNYLAIAGKQLFYFLIMTELTCDFWKLKYIITRLQTKLIIMIITLSKNCTWIKRQQNRQKVHNTNDLILGKEQS